MKNILDGFICEKLSLFSDTDAIAGNFFSNNTTICDSAIGMHFAFFKEKSFSDVHLSPDALNQIVHYFIRVDQTATQVCADTHIAYLICRLYQIANLRSTQPDNSSLLYTTR